ncbi:MAG: DTW domain-containing protein [Bdellovibrio sp.]|nr:DTW domain-containing protein [Bdellovibrio sp.]
MNLQAYQLKKEMQLQQQPQYRNLCQVCIQPQFSCYCSHIKPFDAKINFVVLIHPIEMRRRIATGRMSHLTLKGSYLIMGQNYSDNKDVNQLIDDPEYHSVILYPGLKSKNLTPLSTKERAENFPTNKKLRVFVIDGTWATARKMVRLSQNLHQLPRVGFSPPGPSNFRVRKQPHAGCYSTIEAIHHMIELVGPTQGFDPKSREHDKLLNVFDAMVERQLEFIRISEENPAPNKYRRENKKSA